MSAVWRHQISLGLVAGLVFFTNLGGYALFDEDEPKNAVCGFEMFERGDWIVPTFNAELRTDKPILIYWWMHLSFRLLGVSEFSARIGSALLASASLFLTYYAGCKLYSPTIGWLASIILATSLMFSAVGRAVTPDATLIFCLMLAFTSFIWAVSRRRGGHFSGADGSNHDDCSTIGDLVPASPWTTAPMYVAMGLAILAKGPIGVLLPCTIVGVFLLSSDRCQRLSDGRLKRPDGPWWRRWSLMLSQLLHPRRIIEAGIAMRLALGAVIVLTVALPWYVAVGLRTDGAWLRGFLGDHNLSRFLEPKENHGGPVFYYVVVLLLGCLPWSVFLPSAVGSLRSRLANGSSWSDSDRLLACWAGVWFIFFSLARTKLPNYVLPMYPALALITARYLHEWTQSAPSRGRISFQRACVALGIAGLLIMVGLSVAASVLLPGAEVLMLVGLVPTTGAMLAYLAARHEQRSNAIRLLMGMAVVMAVLVTGVVPGWIDEHLDSPKLAASARQISGKQRPEIAAIDVFSPSLTFYARNPVRELHTPEEVSAFFKLHPDGFVVIRADRIAIVPASLHLVEVARYRRFLKRHDVVLLAPAAQISLWTNATVMQ